MQKYISNIVEQTIHCVYLHPCRLELIFRDLDVEDIKSSITEKAIDNSEDENITAEVITDEINKLNISWDTVIWPEITVLNISSKCTGNDDTRGGGCGNLDLSVDEFKWTCHNPSGITLKDLTEAVYRMKGSKYDYWYELYGSITVELNNPDKQTATVEVDFDYGS